MWRGLCAPICCGVFPDRGTKAPPTLVGKIGGCAAFALEFQHHAFDVAILGVPGQPAMAFLRVAPLHDLDHFLAHAPAIHLARGLPCRDRSCSGPKAPVILHPVKLPGVSQTLEEIKAQGLYKTERIITGPQNAEIPIADGRRVITFARIIISWPIIPRSSRQRRRRSIPTVSEWRACASFAGRRTFTRNSKQP